MNADDAAVTDALMERARAPGGEALLQFASRVSAHQYRKLYRAWRQWVVPDGQVLDWGAGNGHFSYWLQRRGYRVTGYSYETGAFVRWLPDPAHYEFVSGLPDDPSALPFADRTFDAVSSVGVLEHVRETGGDEAASLAEIARVLVAGGVFVAYHFPNRASVIERIAERLPRKHHHAYRYSALDVERLVEAAGLRLVHLERYGLLPRNSANALPRTLRRSRVLARLWDVTDDVLGLGLRALSQNFGFVAKKL